MLASEPLPETDQRASNPARELERLREHIERTKQERARRRRTEVRGTRLRKDEARVFDARAAAVGLDASGYIRGMCLGDRPDLRKIYELVVAFERQSRKAPPSPEQVTALREAVERICRSSRFGKVEAEKRD